MTQTDPSCSNPKSGLALVAALKHPLRSRIIAILEYESATARDLAERLGAPLRTVRYHLRHLRERGLVVVVRSEARRNTVEYCFRLETIGVIDDEMFAELGPSEQRTVINSCFRMIVGGINRFVQSSEPYGPYLPGVARVGLRVDPEGWRRLLSIHVLALEQIIQLKQEAAARLDESNEEGVEVETSLIYFAQRLNEHL